MNKIAQRDVLEILEKAGEPLSVGQIAKLLDDNQKKISKEISKMIKYGEILFKEIDKELANEKYNCKKRMRLYFVDGIC